MRTLWIALLLILAFLCSGFSWGKSTEKKCRDASELIAIQQAKNPGSLPDKLEHQIRELCPNGAAAEYIQGLRFELQGQPDKAMQHYEESIHKDDHFADATGRMGLLQMSRDEKTAAMVSLTRALENGSSNPRYHLVLARLLRETNAYPLAIYHYEKAHSLGIPPDLESYVGMAEAYAGMNKLKEAETSYRNALLLSPSPTTIKTKLAQTIIHQQRFKEGIQLLKEAIAVTPEDKNLHRQLADALSISGDIDSSKTELNLAGISLPNTTTELVQEGDRHFLHRDFPAAIRSYKDAAEKYGTADIYQKLGDTYLAVGNEDDALTSYQTANKLSPDDAGGHYSVAVIMERKDNLSGAIDEYKRAISLDTSNGDAHRRLADIYALKGNLNKSIAEYKKVLEIAPNNPVIHFRLAKVYQKADNYADAIQSIEAAIKLDPSNFEPRRELIKLDIKRNNLPGAEKQCREILAINKDDQQERFRLIGILGRQKKYDDLVSFLSEETSRHPDDYTNYYRLGLVKEYMKDYPAAIDAFLKSIEIKATDRSYHALARTYLRVSDSKKAREALAEANRIDPKRRETKKLLELVDEEYGHSHAKAINKPAKKHKKKRSHGSRSTKKK